MKARNRVAVLAIGLLSTASLGACSAGASGTDEVVIVIGAHAGAPAVTPSHIEPYLDRIDQVGDRITLVVADGAPFVAFDLVIDTLPGNAIDRRERLAQIKDDVLVVASRVVAVTSEVDVVEAIAVSARGFTDAPGSKTLVILDPMIQTTGSMSMLDGRLYDDPVDRVAYVGETGGVAALAGIDVTVPRLGLVEPPQAPLDAGALASLMAVWEEYFSNTGADSVSFEAANLNQRPQAATDLPTVTPVAIDRPTVPTASSCTQLMGDSLIGFIRNKTVFVDDAAATAVIADAARSLRGCEGDILVEGSTSSDGSAAANLLLSEARARAVAGPLAEALGIPVSRIGVVGWGVEWPCRSNDRDEHGDLIAAMAAANRAVVISRGVEPGSCA